MARSKYANERGMKAAGRAHTLARVLAQTPARFRVWARP